MCAGSCCSHCQPHHCTVCSVAVPALLFCTYTATCTASTCFCRHTCAVYMHCLQAWAAPCREAWAGQGPWAQAGQAWAGRQACGGHAGQAWGWAALVGREWAGLVGLVVRVASCRQEGRVASRVAQAGLAGRCGHQCTCRAACSSRVHHHGRSNSSGAAAVQVFCICVAGAFVLGSLGVMLQCCRIVSGSAIGISPAAIIQTA
jgi:hypothetical protein